MRHPRISVNLDLDLTFSCILFEYMPLLLLETSFCISHPHIKSHSVMSEVVLRRVVEPGLVTWALRHIDLCQQLEAGEERIIYNQQFTLALLHSLKGCRPLGWMQNFE